MRHNALAARRWLWVLVVTIPFGIACALIGIPLGLANFKLIPVPAGRSTGT